MSKSYIGWLREQVGHQKIISTSAVAVIRDEHRRVLLQKRRDFGVWGLPGGLQELGERIDETVRREVREEVGLEVKPKRIIGICTSPRLDRLFPNGDQVQPYLVSFGCEIVGGAQKIEEAEVLAIDWFDFDNLPPVTPVTQQVLRDEQNFRGEAFFDREVNHADTSFSYYKWLRQHIGHAKIILPGAAGMVRDAQGRVLLQRRRDNGLWGFPGGLMELGESASDAIRREFREETGLLIEPRRLVGVYTSPEFDRCYPNGDQSQLFASFFECAIIGGALKMQEEEVLELGWFDLNGDLPPMIPCCAAKARDARVFNGAAFWR
jgi:8-oxo-dGTP pyrophosphatase MutT (NUDIX family)